MTQTPKKILGCSPSENAMQKLCKLKTMQKGTSVHIVCVYHICNCWSRACAIRLIAYDATSSAHLRLIGCTSNRRQMKSLSPRPAIPEQGRTFDYIDVQLWGRVIPWHLGLCCLQPRTDLTSSVHDCKLIPNALNGLTYIPSPMHSYQTNSVSAVRYTCIVAWFFSVDCNHHSP